MKSKFNFSKAEKIGTSILSLIIIVLLVLLNRPSESFMPNLLVSDTVNLNYIYSDKKYDQKSLDRTKNKSSKIYYQVFNPNNYGVSDWRKIGFSKKQSQVILKYKDQINGFKSKKDIANCYVISKKKYKEIESFLVFNNLKDSDSISLQIEKPVVDLNIIDLNSANSVTLETVQGIGPFYSEKIIEYRNRLGGYVNVDQIKEIYGMTEENFDRIADQLIVDDNKVQKMDLLTANFNELKKHPYLNWKQSQIIISIANEEKNDDFWNELIKNEAFTELDVKRIRPYFK